MALLFLKLYPEPTLTSIAKITYARYRHLSRRRMTGERPIRDSCHVILEKSSGIIEA